VYRPLIGLSLAALLATLSGCRREPVALASNATPSASTSSSAAPFDDAKFDTAAKAFVEAVLAHAETCNLEADSPAGWFDFITYDVCSTSPKDIDPALAAAQTLESGVSERANLTKSDMPMAARAFLDQARIERDWLGGVEKIQVSRGTMRSYQALSIAYNGYKPDAKLPTEPKHALDQYFVAYPSRSVAYIWEQVYCYEPNTFVYNGCDPSRPHVRMDRYAIHRHRGTPLEWRTSAQGPFLAD